MPNRCVAMVAKKNKPLMMSMFFTAVGNMEKPCGL